MRLYRYVGPKRIADRAGAAPSGVVVRRAEDVVAWARDSGQALIAARVTATFVIGATGELLIADRRSEHVVCAGGGPVRSAGEMTFALWEGVEAVEVSNQSTGYCPEPESWPAVAEALARAGLRGPGGFAPSCTFRRCGSCGGVNLVKGGVFECGVCGADLPAAYNVQGADPD
jgi:hypothetical protein